MINTVLRKEIALEVLHEMCMKKLFLLAIQKARYIRNQPQLHHKQGLLLYP